jgi:hypothetical protein
LERALLRAMKEVAPEWLPPRRPEGELVARMEAELETLLAKMSREERGLEAAEDEIEEEVAHKRLASLVRTQGPGVGAGTGAGAGVHPGVRADAPVPHQTPADELGRVWTRVKALIVVYIQKGNYGGVGAGRAGAGGRCSSGRTGPR